jgi:hypothetical protein
VQRRHTVSNRKSALILDRRTISQSRVHDQNKNGKNKKQEGFPVNLNNHRVKLDLPVTRKTEPKKSKQETKTN